MKKNMPPKKVLQNKRMTSIVKKMQRNVTWKKLQIYIGMDITFAILFLAGWIAEHEYEAFGGWVLECKRKLTFGKTLEDFQYYVWNQDGQQILHLYMREVLLVLGWGLAIIFGLQLFRVLFSLGREARKIRRILAPIDAMAIKADELGKMTFSEDKYQVIEHAISELEPDDSSRLSFGDEELEGIELAMNNLLRRMRETYQQQARFVNDASHELRTPIAVIEGYVNMLARWGKEDEKVLDESITALQREAGHMKHLVEQLLFLARGDSGKTKLELKEVSLKECMQEIYEESLLIDEEHIYRYRQDEDIYIKADFMMLKQAVRILVDNAAKYTNKQDEIYLSIGRNEEGKPYLQVQDTGIGMAQQDVEHMFERFYRADDARRYKGTGLGLSIAKWIVDKHGGHFEILSRTELGTRVRIVLEDEVVKVQSV